MNKAMQKAFARLAIATGLAFFSVANMADAYVLNDTPPASRLTMNLAMQALIGNQPVSAAMAKWNEAGIGPGQDHNFFIAQSTGISGNCGHNQVNEVTSSETNCGLAFGDSTLAVTMRWSSGGKVVEVDTMFNSNKRWDSYSGPLKFNGSGMFVHDINRVALHEMGHAAGLNHPDQAGQSVNSIMNSIIGDLDSLQTDDIEGAHAIAWQVGAPDGTPQCVLTASPTSIDAGGNSTLVVSCSPAATSYAWTNSGFAATTSGGVVAPTTTTTYTVKGSNASGAGNTASVTVTVANASSLPDLEIMSLTGPGLGTVGQQVTLVAEVHNNGSAAASPIRVGYYLSHDEVPSSSDILIGTCTFSNGLLVDQTSLCVGTATIPANLPPTTYILRAVVDDTFAVRESDETNNARSATPDIFYVFAVALPASTKPVPVPAPGAAANYADMWWAGNSGNGWGLSIQQHGNSLFAALYVYDAAGKPVWYVIPGGTWDAAFTTFSGDVYQPTSAPLNNYSPTRFAPGAPIGSVIISFTGSASAELRYTINGIFGRQSIQRMAFGSGVAPFNVGDMWWGGTAQDGWGISLTQQAGAVFGAWYTYGPDGRVTWYVLPTGTWSGNTYSGAIYSTTGSPWLGAEYDPNRLIVTEVGRMSLNFTNNGSATMTYSFTSGPFAGTTQSREIVRQPF